jgi:hypothetical protein
MSRGITVTRFAWMAHKFLWRHDTAIYNLKARASNQENKRRVPADVRFFEQTNQIVFGCDLKRFECL